MFCVTLEGKLRLMIKKYREADLGSPKARTFKQNKTKEERKRSSTMAEKE